MDMRPLAEPQSGIARYVRELASALADVPDIDLHLMFKGAVHDFTMRTGRVDVAPTSVWLHRHVPAYVQANALDVFHGTNFVLPWAKRCAHVVTIHDVTLFRHVWHHSLRNVLSTGVQMLLTMSSAERIIAVSRCTAIEFGKLFPRLASRVRVVPHGVGKQFVPGSPEDRGAARFRFNAGRHYLLALGRLDSRKNLGALVRAFAYLANGPLQNHDLLLVGPMGNASARLAELIRSGRLTNRIRMVGRVPEADLPQLLRGADMLVHVSHAEGFALPVLEAMACATPVVAVPDPAVTEYAEGVAAFTADYSAEAIAEEMRRMAARTPRYDGSVAEGVTRAGNATWQAAARCTVATYREAADALTAKSIGRNAS